MDASILKEMLTTSMPTARWGSGVRRSEQRKDYRNKTMSEGWAAQIVEFDNMWHNMFRISASCEKSSEGILCIINLLCVIWNYRNKAISSNTFHLLQNLSKQPHNTVGGSTCTWNKGKKTMHFVYINNVKKLNQLIYRKLNIFFYVFWDNVLWISAISINKFK